MADTSRTFSASLKPAWTDEEMKQFANKMTGVATVFLINHDSDVDEETGEVKETHTHILIDYDTPRKITTVANLLEVAPNFIELVKSKKAMLRYLTHRDDPEKYQYLDDLVVSNSDVPYTELIIGQALSDREIARALMEGRGVDLLGVVSATKLRTIQAFLQFDRTGAIQQELKAVNEKLDRLNRFVDKVEQITTELTAGIAHTSQELVAGLVMIGDEIKRVRRLPGR